MNNFNGLIVVQCRNQYRIFTPQQILIAQIALPPDEQYVRDVKVLHPITSALAYRWGIKTK